MNFAYTNNVVDGDGERQVCFGSKKHQQFLVSYLNIGSNIFNLFTINHEVLFPWRTIAR